MQRPARGKLHRPDMCKRCDAGVIPMRETLLRLVTGDFVVAEDQCSFRVAGVSADELRDITQTRVFLSSEALRRAIALGDLDWEQRLIGVNYRLDCWSMLDSRGQLGCGLGAGTHRVPYGLARSGLHTRLCAQERWWWQRGRRLKETGVQQRSKLPRTQAKQ